MQSESKNPSVSNQDAGWLVLDTGSTLVGSQFINTVLACMRFFIRYGHMGKKINVATCADYLADFHSGEMLKGIKLVTKFRMSFEHTLWNLPELT